MSEFVEVKTAELVGPSLDWAVAMAEFWEADRPRDGQIRKGDVYMLVGPFRLIGLGADMFYSPSTDWAQGGQLRDKYDVGIEHGVPDGIPYAYLPGRYLDGSRGETALIALCRAIVAAKLGEVVQIPTELAGVHR